VAFLQLGGIAGAHERGGGVCGQETEQVDGESFVGVEVAAIAPRLAQGSERYQLPGSGVGKLTCESRSRGRRS
jgi:hypothetical protein